MDVGERAEVRGTEWVGNRAEFRDTQCVGERGLRSGVQSGWAREG